MPGRKDAYRLYGADGHALVDLLQQPDEPPVIQGNRVLCRHPFQVYLVVICTSACFCFRFFNVWLRRFYFIVCFHGICFLLSRMLSSNGQVFFGGNWLLAWWSAAAAIFHLTSYIQEDWRHWWFSVPTRRSHHSQEFKKPRWEKPNGKQTWGCDTGKIQHCLHMQQQ